MIDTFLLISDYNQFTEAKKIAEQQLPKRDFKLSIARRTLENGLDSLDLEHLETPKEELIIKISPFLRRFFEGYNSIADQKKMLIGGLRDLSNELSNALLNVDRILSDMGRISAKLHQTVSEFNQAQKNSEDAVFENTFFALQNNFICLAEVYRRESKAVKDNYFSMFLDWEKELSSLNEVVKIRNWSQEEYCSFKADLKDRKLKLLNGPPGKEKLEFDQISMKYACIDKESEDFKRNKLKFMLPDVCYADKEHKSCQEDGRLFRIRQPLDLQPDYSVCSKKKFKNQSDSGEVCERGGSNFGRGKHW